jgi:hypothetical protein
MPTKHPTVTFLGSCDRCGRPDATWHGVRTEQGGTDHVVDCPGCDKPWSVAAQLARRGEVEATVLPGRLPSVQRIVRRSLLGKLISRVVRSVV